MNDTLTRITELVKGEIKKLALGEPVGVSVTQSFVPVNTPQGLNLMPGWIITVDTRSPLLGQDPMAFPVIIPCQPGYMPSDRAFKDSAKMALEGMRNLYQEALSQMNSTPENAPANVVDGSGLVLGK